MGLASMLRFLSLLLVSAFLVSPPAEAQKGKLSKVEFKGSSRYPAEQVAAAIGLQLGENIGRDELQAAADRLVQLGPFKSVRYRFSSRGEDVTVEFEVEEAPLYPVSFDNFPWFTDEELIQGLKEAVPFFNGVAPDGGAMIEQMKATLQQMLEQRGIRAQVEAVLIGRPGEDGMMQQFRVARATLKIGSVEFGHALPSEAPRVRQTLDTLVGKPFSRFAIAMYLTEQVRPLYLERGHLRVHFGPPRARFTGDPNKPLPDNVQVMVPIEPGPVFQWAGAEWNGNTVFAAAQLDEFLGTKAGDVADGGKVIGGLERVRSEYGRRGYLDLKLESEPVFDDTAGRVRYRVRIEEGPQYRMGKLIITGLSVPAERRLTDAWKIAPGAVFDKMYFEEFLATGIKQAFADTVVHYDSVGHWLRKNAESKIVDVLLDFQ